MRQVKSECENSLNNYLYNRNLNSSCVLIHEYEKMNNYFGEVNESLNERFMKNPHFDYIFENLQTHDVNFLIDKIDEFFGKIIVYVDLSNYQKGRKNAFSLFTKNDVDLKNNISFKNLLDFYGYYVTRSIYNRNLDLIQIDICPTYPENKTKYVIRKCHGIIYHMTNIENSEYIERNGLKIRNNEYREFPKRIYFFAFDNFLNVKEKIKSELKDMEIDIFSDKIIYKLNINNYNIDIYDDDIMDGNCFFTYTNIPNNLICGKFKL